MQPLLQLAQTLLANPLATAKELNAVYVPLKGVSCRTVSKMRFVLQEFISNPARYERAIQTYQQDKAEQMEVKKYRFSAAYLKAGEPNIILHSPSLIVVKKDQLTDQKAELLANHPQYRVYVELIEAPKVEQAPVTEAIEAPKKKKKAAKKSV